MARAAFAASVVMGVLAVGAGATLALDPPTRDKKSRLNVRYCARGACHNAQWWADRSHRQYRQRLAAERRAAELEARLAHMRSRLRRLQTHTSDPVASGATGTDDVIRATFGVYGEQAVHVAWCESRLDTSAQNGQYEGLFQMGSSERATYGHGPDASSQAAAAYRYFVASGSDWSPWDPRCRP